MTGTEAIQKLLAEYQFLTVLDVGCGIAEHARIFLNAGKAVTGIDLKLPDMQYPHWNGVEGDFTEIAGSLGQYDLVWASHVLEHQKDPIRFIELLRDRCVEAGTICITVPPLKHQIVTGHLTLWNAGLLLVHMVHAGLNCQKAKVKRYGYNISVIVAKTVIADPPKPGDNIDDFGGLYLPDGYGRNRFNGDIEKINWS